MDIDANASVVKHATTEFSFRNTRTSRDFAEAINAAWRKGSKAFMEAGRILLEAKEELSKDEFDALLKLKLDLNASVGRKLMRSVANPILCAHVHKLPPCYSTIYELSKVPDDILETAIADGRVNTKMMRKDAVVLRESQEDESEEDDCSAGEDNGSSQGEDAKTKLSELLKLWGAATADEQLAVLKRHGVDGILELLKDDKDFLAKLYDRVVGLQVALASPVAASKSSKKLLTNLTGTMHWALGQDDPVSSAHALAIIKNKLAANRRDPKDICFSFAKKAKR